jgi:hypothetical protein
VIFFIAVLPPRVFIEKINETEHADAGVRLAAACLPALFSFHSLTERPETYIIRPASNVHAGKEAASPPGRRR